MTGKLSKNFHGFGIGPLSKILAVKEVTTHVQTSLQWAQQVGIVLKGMLLTMDSFDTTSYKDKQGGTRHIHIQIL